MSTDRELLAEALDGITLWGGRILPEWWATQIADALLPVVDRIAAARAAAVREAVTAIVDEMEDDESIGIPPHVPLLIAALRSALDPT